MWHLNLKTICLIYFDKFQLLSHHHHQPASCLNESLEIMNEKFSLTSAQN